MCLNKFKIILSYFSVFHYIHYRPVPETNSQLNFTLTAIFLESIIHTMKNNFLPVCADRSKRKSLIIFCSIAIFSIFTNQYIMAQDDERIKRGKEAYKKYCSVCHGKTGSGDGPGSEISGVPPAILQIKPICPFYQMMIYLR